MITRITVAALSLCLGACASSGPEAPVTDTVDTAASGQTASATGNENPELDATGAEANAVASAEYDPNEVICRREKEAGSNFYKKTCFTRAQLDARAEEDQEALRQMRHMRSGSQNETNPGG